MGENGTVMEAMISATESEVLKVEDRQSLLSPLNGDSMKCNTQGDTSEPSDKNKNSGGYISAPTYDGDREKSLQFVAELINKGSVAVKEHDFSEATDCFSRALEIRAALYGELSLDCLELYYKYGCALLYKAQEEADPLVTLPNTDDAFSKKQEEKRQTKNVLNSESSSASIANEVELDGDSNQQEGTEENDGEEDEEESDGEDIREADDEDESDLDLAWKMLDVARVISEKQPVDTVMKVDILSALAEVALEREDMDTSLCDYQKALSILEHLVEPDNRYLAELNFRICLCLEIGSRAEEAIPYCEKAISICKSKIQHLSQDGAKAPSQPSNSATEPREEGESVGTEIQTLSGLAEELEKKLEDLQQHVENPTSVLSEIMNIMSAANKTKGSEDAPPPQFGSSQMGVSRSGESSDSTTVSTAHTGGEAAGVVHLGVVGRGAKRVVINSEVSESGKAKKRRELSSVLENEGQH